MKPLTEAILADSKSTVALVQQSEVLEVMRAPVATFNVECLEAKPEHFAEVVEVQARIHALENATGFQRFVRKLTGRLVDARAEAKALHDFMCRELMRPKWALVEHNVVTTVGKNDLLDKYLAGSAYTAAWFCGLISSVSFTAVAAADTMASHAGWTEAGPTNAPNYSSGTRVALTFAAASGGSKATSSASSFTFSAGGTIKGMFGTSVSTKDGTTGILYNAVLFTGGDRVVVNTDVVNVSVTYSA